MPCPSHTPPPSPSKKEYKMAPSTSRRWIPILNRWSAITGVGGGSLYLPIILPWGRLGGGGGHPYPWLKKRRSTPPNAAHRRLRRLSFLLICLFSLFRCLLPSFHPGIVQNFLLAFVGDRRGRILNNGERAQRQTCPSCGNQGTVRV